MRSSMKRVVLSLFVGGVLQLAFAGCSSQSPMDPASSEPISTALITNRPAVVTTADVNTGTQAHQGTVDARTATDFSVRPDRDEVEMELSFTGLIVGFDVETQTIRLMEMEGSFKTWIGHVTENTEMIGLDGETVQLSDFGVCSQAITRGEQIDEDEFTINYLKMKNF